MPLVNFIKPIKNVSMYMFGNILRQLELLLLVEEPCIESMIVVTSALCFGDVNHLQPDGILLSSISMIDVKHHH